MATHSSILAWRILWTERPGGLQYMGSQRVRHDWSDWGCTQSNIYQFSTVAQLCMTLCNPMDCSTLGFAVHHQLPSLLKLMPIESIMPSYISSSVVLFSCLQSFPASGFFFSQWISSLHQVSIGFSASLRVLPMNTKDWFTLGLTCLISLQSKRLLRVF